jgi:delta 1-pyrroline-5-carboxylate dehydrogenase
VPVATFADLRRGDRPRQRARLRAVVVDLHHRPAHAFRFRERVSAGMVSVNNSTSGAEAHLPFGGNGKSGNGARQSGIWVLDQVTRWQSMNWDYSGKLQKAQMDVAECSAASVSSTATSNSTPTWSPRRRSSSADAAGYSPAT